MVRSGVHPLAGLRVLDLSEGVAGPFCAKLLGDLGADVVKVERPQGDVTRQIGPFRDGVANPEQSAAFFYFNTSKRSVVLDPDTAEGRAALARLVSTYDVVVASETIEALEQRGLGYDVFAGWNPRVILTTVSGFGSFGPNSHYASSHLIACAVGGWCHLCGTPDKEPLQVGGSLSETLAGAFAAVATQLAVMGRARHGRGDHVDVSTQEAVLAGAQMPTLLYEYRGIAPERYSSVGSGAGACYMLPTRTGYIGLNALTRPQWHMLCAFLGREDIAEDPRFLTMSWTNPDERLEEVREVFRAATADASAEDLFHEAEKHRVPFGLVPDMKGMFDLAPLRERGFFVPLEHPTLGTVETPGVPFVATAMEPKPYRPPLLGEHTDEVLASLADDPVVEVSDSTDEPNPLPLEGVRVLDLSMFFAGPVCAQIAADAGAEVIKVESVQRIDGWRGAGSSNADDELPGWESSPYFNWVNRNKRDVTLNLTDPRGAVVIRRLVEDADCLIENYTPRVMAKFGLSYEELKAINPRLVMISLSGFGATTSWRDYVAFGMSTEQMSGATHLTGYLGGDPLFTGTTGGDLYAGVMGANALFAALQHRDATGVGQHIDFGQVEACSVYLGDAITAWSLADYDPGRIGNDHHHFPLQGVFPCRNDRWIAITCRDQDELAALADIVGVAAEPASLLDALPDWTRTREHRATMDFLQARGVPAGAVQNGPEILDDPQVAARGGLLVQDRPGLGEKHYPNQPYRLRRTQPPPVERAPLLGEHSAEILTELGGLSDDDLAELIIDDVVGTVPMAAR